ncbi:hypothetical protein MNV49_007415 [Pseudohyphozyma bogoriensis]|nr:hypothetical protein MNV49_007415 [Pseudohyphozyma bogoriensis]
MASTAQEAAFLDGTHPALSGNAEAMEALRSGSPTRSPSPSSPPSSPRFSAVDTETYVDEPPPLNKTNKATGASNTGPKGVLADYQARGTIGNTNNTGPKGVLADYQGNQSTLAQGMRFVSLSDAVEPQEEEEDDVDEVEAWRAKRRLELMGSGERRSSRKTFGHLREIGMDQFLSAVEEEDPEVAVVLHLYEPGIEACHVLNSHLSAIARSYPHTKFIRAQATDLEFSEDTEEDTLPTVLVYRGGELETTLVRLDRDWGTGTKREIERLLLQSKAVQGSPVVDRFGNSSPREDDSGDDSD